MTFKLLVTLLKRLGRIEAAIQQEYKQKWPDGSKLSKLKKLRLRLKDGLAHAMRRSIFAPKRNLKFISK